MIALYNTGYLLNVKVREFSVRLWADYKNTTENIPSPTILVGKLHLWWEIWGFHADE